MMETLANSLIRLRDSDSVSDNIDYVRYLNRLGRIGKRLYKLNPNTELKLAILDIQKMKKESEEPLNNFITQ